MSALIRFFWELCLLRRAPQDLPASQSLLGVLVGANVVIGAAGALGAYGGLGRAVAASVLHAAVAAALVYGTLVFAGHRARFIQTLAAVFGVGALFGAVLLVVQLLLGVDGEQPLLALLHLALLGWAHVAFGHVLRHALDMDLWAGIAIAVGYTVIGVIVVNTYLPPLAVGGT